MSHHGMHIPPNMLPLLPGMNPFEKTDKAKKQQRLKKSASTGEMELVDETKDDEEFNLKRVTARQQPQQRQPDTKAGGRPAQHQLSDKTVKSLLQVQEGVNADAAETAADTDIKI